jgi:hypothetical protein
MGVSHSARLIVGEIFNNRQEVENYIRENLKIALSSEDDELLEESLEDFLENREDLPEIESLDLFSDDEFYLGYSVFNNNAEKLVINVQRAVQAWKEVFNTEPNVYNKVRYS